MHRFRIFRPGSSSSNSYQGSAIVMLWYLINLFLCVCFPLIVIEQISWFSFDFFFFLCVWIYLWSKYATVIWNWRTRCSMEARLLAWKFVTLGILRYIYQLMLVLSSWDLGIFCACYFHFYLNLRILLIAYFSRRCFIHNPSQQLVPLPISPRKCC